jgi:hypothetical protein
VVNLGNYHLKSFNRHGKDIGNAEAGAKTTIASLEPIYNQHGHRTMLNVFPALNILEIVNEEKRN